MPRGQGWTNQPQAYQQTGRRLAIPLRRRHPVLSRPRRLRMFCFASRSLRPFPRLFLSRVTASGFATAHQRMRTPRHGFYRSFPATGRSSGPSGAGWWSTNVLLCITLFDRHTAFSRPIKGQATSHTRSWLAAGRQRLLTASYEGAAALRGRVGLARRCLARASGRAG